MLVAFGGCEGRCSTLSCLLSGGGTDGLVEESGTAGEGLGASTDFGTEVIPLGAEVGGIETEGVGAGALAPVPIDVEVEPTAGVVTVEVEAVVIEETAEPGSGWEVIGLGAVAVDGMVEVGAEDKEVGTLGHDVVETVIVVAQVNRSNLVIVRNDKTYLGSPRSQALSLLL